ncbi:hypothetical protein [Litchfieldella rifensis]|uniref:Uncharacterized protein n=1 Tax=Litchfieldella rifensis TaxID=762643 RepID=A0ABV7LQ15_9GAMM
MSGLLRRLARQATGQAPARVHAPARLPYHAAPDPLSEEASSPLTTPAPRGTDTPHPADATPAPMTASTTADTSAPIAPPPPPLIGEAPRGDVSDPTPADTETPTTVRTTPAPSDAAPIAAQATPPGPEETPDAWDARIEPASVAHRREAAEMPTSKAPDVAAASTRDTPYPPEPERQAPPEALLPPLVDRPLTPRSTAAATPSLAADSAAEVHVHIGRIEVTAVQEPAPTKRPSKRGPSPMSLDEYLASRRGSRS